MKTLLVFDFDHTIIDENSDTWVVRCTPENKLPHWLRKSYQGKGWNEYMGRVLGYIGAQGINESKMKQVMEAIPYTPGMVNLLQFICQNKDFFDCIIISDSNTVFIDWILKATESGVSFNRIFSNPAGFDDQGHLTLQSFHSHDCSQCPDNLCKKKVLLDFVDDQFKAGVRYSRTIYIGDGGNDVCPTVGLKTFDIVMPRKGYRLEKQLHKMVSEDIDSIQPSVIVWSSGEEILSHLRKYANT
uniref:Phosphatase, orphan 2 n=1 Tax=Callorhinchus milii TaxID=7868 RepID=V9L950_CALMI|eukprot:gi/632945639/ref/XP_007888165.1/ PREDICTED: pyridoxal phosphate phosphatase PHOSPHO2 [Callorhinchus milii]